MEFSIRSYKKAGKLSVYLLHLAIFLFNSLFLISIKNPVQSWDQLLCGKNTLISCADFFVQN